MDSFRTDLSQLWLIRADAAHALAITFGLIVADVRTDAHDIATWHGLFAQIAHLLLFLFHDQDSTRIAGCEDRLGIFVHPSFRLTQQHVNCVCHDVTPSLQVSYGGWLGLGHGYPRSVSNARLPPADYASSDAVSSSFVSHSLNSHHRRRA